MRSVLAHAMARLARRRGRALLAAGGIAAAGAMLGASVTVGYGLATGFDRAAAAAELPDAIARFDEAPVDEVHARARTLANVRAVAYRLEEGGVPIEANGEYEYGRVAGVRDGPRGYAIVDGRDVERDGELVVERGLARAWKLAPGDAVRLAGVPVRLVGVAISPETVAYPLAASPRAYASYETVRALGSERDGAVDVALLWVNDRSRLDVTLSQARAASFGLEHVEFVTRSGIRVLVGQAAGIVIALLVAFAFVALAAAGAMLAASAATEVQRRLASIGVLRAVGASRRDVALAYAVEAVLVAAPAGAVGILAGWAAVAGPTARLLEALNQLPPGPVLALLLAGCLVGVVAIVAAASAWPAWRAASRSPVEAMRGADVAVPPRHALGTAGAAGLGVRLALARPVRTAGAVVVLAAATSVVLLMLAIASLLRSLAEDPHAIGKRYQLAVAGAPGALRTIEALPGVEDAALRYETYAADSFRLGESFEVIAFAGARHTRYEAPPLAEGRRLAADGEAEVGLGLAQALNLHPGGTLAAQLPGGREVRFRVAGIVRALEREGRVVYVAPRRLLRAEPFLQPTVAVRVERGASVDDVERLLEQNGFWPQPVGGVAGEAVQGWAARNSGFVEILVSLLRSVAVIEALVCLYALAQMLALTAQERRRAVAVVRAVGAGRLQVMQLFAAAALVVVLVAAPLGFALERLVVAPAVTGLAASYALLPLEAGAPEGLAVALGLVLGSLAVAGWVARGVVRAPVVAGLRDD